MAVRKQCAGVPGRAAPWAARLIQALHTRNREVAAKASHKAIALITAFVGKQPALRLCPRSGRGGFLLKPALWRNHGAFCHAWDYISALGAALWRSTERFAEPYLASVRSACLWHARKCTYSTAPHVCHTRSFGS